MSLSADVDASQLARWFDANGIDLTEPVRLTLIAGGRSNLTYQADDAAGRSYVLRRPPMGNVLPSAHDVAREHRIISALDGSGVPVPHSYGLCTDPSVFGAPFYVMNLVPGVVVAVDSEGSEYPVESRTLASIDLVDIMARIHLLDVDEVGLGALGRKEDYGQRQLRRWHRQFHESSDRDLPLVDEVHRRLSSAIPPQKFTGLVHGDLRPGNVLLSPDGRVNAVLDWELATLGDTLADLGWLVATWRMPGEPELLESPTAHPGWLSRAELINRYSERTGHDVSDIGWYRAFALWRLTCIGEGIYSRYRAGVMGNDGFDIEAQALLVVRLAEAAHAALADL